MRRLLQVLVLLLAAPPALADVSGRMRELFDGLGTYGSVDGPRYLAAQSRHVFSGGGLQYRAPRRTYQLYSATGPSLQAGCGGIDLYAGSFSFINKDKFVQMLKSIAGNSVGLAFKTALCSTSANLCQAVEDIQRTVEQLNRFNIDSCEVAKQLVGGAMGSAEQSSQSACIANARMSNIASDTAAARQLCAQPQQYARIRKTARTHRRDTQPLEFTGGNLTWQILKKGAGHLAVDDREFLMSMLGTHVVTTVSIGLRYHPPTITDLAALNERKVVMLKCLDTQAHCESVGAQTVILSASFMDLSRTRLIEIRRRIDQGVALSSVQLRLIAGSPLPVLALVQADLAGAAGLLDMAAEAIAYASAYQYLTASLRSVAGLAAGWQARSANEAELVQGMIRDTRQLRAALTEELHASLRRVNAMLEAGEHLRELRRSIASDRFGPLIRDR